MHGFRMEILKLQRLNITRQTNLKIMDKSEQTTTVFTRDATGLVRSWSTLDFFIYSWMGGPGIWSPVLIFIVIYGAYAFPAANMPLATVFTILFLVPVYLAYAMLGAAMPRSGGDYVFNTRILPTALGVAVMFPTMVFTQQWNYWNAYAIATLGLSPLETLYGNVANVSNSLSSGLGLLGFSVGLIVLAGVIMALGMRFYAALQRILFIIALASVAAFVIIMAGSTQPAFAQAFNSFEGSTLGHPNAYGYVVSSAEQAGYNPTPWNIWSTLGLMPFIAGTIMFAMQGVINIGEVRNADSVKRTSIGVVGGGIAAGGTIALLLFLIVNTFGQTFLGSISFHFNNATPVASELGSPPLFTFLAALLTNNPLLVYILSAGVISGLFLFFPGIYIYGTRYLFAMSFDRLLPSSMAGVNSRTHAPVVAIAVMAMAQILWGVLFTFTTIGVFVSSVIFVSLAAMTLTCISAIVFPYLKHTKNTYQNSSLTKYKIGSLPAIVLVGILGLVTLSLFFYYFATVPELGSNSPVSVAFMLGSFVVGALIYFVAKAYHRHRGLNLAWVYKEIPPE